MYFSWDRTIVIAEAGISHVSDLTNLWYRLEKKIRRSRALQLKLFAWSLSFSDISENLEVVKRISFYDHMCLRRHDDRMEKA